MSRRTRSLVTALALLATILGGCVSGPATTPSPSPAATVQAPSPTSEPTPLPATSLAPLDATGAFSGMVEVRGHDLFTSCTESVDDGQTVVLEHGGGVDHSVWSPVRDGLSHTVRVCAYDRANAGRSEDVGPQTSGDSVEDLHALLRAIGVQTPVVLVGHSQPGLQLRIHAGRYPGDVAGLVFVDPLVPFIEQLQLDALPEPIEGEPPGLSEFRDQLATWIDENDRALAAYDYFLFNESFRQAQAVESFGRLPVIVLTRTEYGWIRGAAGDEQLEAIEAKLHEIWVEQHRQLAELSTNGAHRMVESGHEVLREAPEVVIAAILAVIAEVRGAS